MTVLKPDWRSPTPSTWTVWDQSNLREHIWFSLISSYLYGGQIIPTWPVTSTQYLISLNGYTADVFIWTGPLQVRIKAEQYYQLPDDGQPKKIDHIIFYLDRNLGEGFEEVDRGRGDITYNASNQVISVIWS